MYWSGCAVSICVAEVMTRSGSYGTGFACIKSLLFGSKLLIFPSGWYLSGAVR